MIDGNCINGEKSVYRITSNWDEASVEWKKPWTNLGGDYEDTPIAQNNNDQVKVWEEYDVTSVIKDIVENSGENYGFILKFDRHTPAYGVMIASSEYNDESKRPKLTVTYDMNTSVGVENIKEDKRHIAFKRTQKNYLIYIPFAESKIVTITDLQGRQIVSFGMGSSEQWHQIPVGLVHGIYVIHVRASDKTVARKLCVSQ